ncbi:MAG: acyl-CoA dehydrogenase family protein [Actinobacteria bacterium]|nr:acyl-CoA dehydrogenase family protein [Actinomycetota bacterium]
MSNNSTAEPSIQELFRTTARSFLEAKAPIDWVHARADEDQTLIANYLWDEIAEMGWTGLTFPEASGGAGLKFSDQVFLFEELGRALYPGPYFANFALAAACIAHDPALVQRLIDGESTFTLAWAEPNHDGFIEDLGSVFCRAEPDGSSGRLSGV